MWPDAGGVGGQKQLPIVDAAAVSERHLASGRGDRGCGGAQAPVKGTVGSTATLAALPSTVARIVAPALTALGADHPQLAVTCLITDQAQLRELTLGTVDVVLGQHYHHLPETRPKGIAVSPLLNDPLLVVTADDGAAGGSDERPVGLRELATHHLVLPPATTDCGQAILHACHQAGFTPTTRYVTADIAAQLVLARSGLATAHVPQTAVAPATPGIRTAPIKDHPIQRLLFAATRHTETTNPTTAAVIAALRTAAWRDRTTHLPPCRFSLSVSCADAVTWTFPFSLTTCRPAAVSDRCHSLRLSSRLQLPGGVTNLNRQPSVPPMPAQSLLARCG
ncbi:LysR substrate-binding domain-containing protein [Streptomyces sp. NPDC002587]